MKIVFFDVETQRTFDEVGGRHNIRKLGLSAAVTYSSADGAFHHYTEETVDDLVAELKTADLVVGFNVLNFDYEVLHAYTDDSLDRLPTVDMLDHIYKRLGFRVSLDNLAASTLGTAKSADGLQAVRWYKQGRIQEILDYCQQDVEVTRQLYEYGKQQKHVKYRDRNYREQMVPVSW
ncbi:MAG TPA: ribonuclease H-like domain-containing protein [Anaerolineae bacterium]|nr:ribonuclease H-like domain-containing protein [Anaerolineae bacterium]